MAVERYPGEWAREVLRQPPLNRVPWVRDGSNPPEPGQYAVDLGAAGGLMIADYWGPGHWSSKGQRIHVPNAWLDIGHKQSDSEQDR